jgi:hypothetical protein
MEENKRFEVPDLGEERRETDNDFKEEELGEENLEMEPTGEDLLEDVNDTTLDI